MGYESHMDDYRKAYAKWETKVLTKIGLFVESDAKLRVKTGQYFSDEFSEQKGKVGGNLRSSIGNKVDQSEHVVHVGTNVEYALWVEKGTEPHLIVPRVKKMLHWADKSGRGYLAHAVVHPGSKAYPFLTPAVENNVSKLQQLVDNTPFDEGNNEP